MNRPVLRYHGGKWMLAPWIISHFPAHRTYCEPFGGGASVLMRKPRAFAEIYNDLDGRLVNVFRVLRDPASSHRLRELLELTPFARAEFEAAYADSDDPVELARRTILLSFMGHGSDAVGRGYRTGFRSNSSRQYTTPAHDWSRYPPQVLTFHERLRGVVLEQRDALEVLGRHDDWNTLHYVDPPYPHSTRTASVGKHGYAHEMTDEDHARLVRALRELRGMVLVSGYRCQLYDDAFGDWERRDVHTLADGARERVESLWLNPAAAAHQRQRSLL